MKASEVNGGCKKCKWYLEKSKSNSKVSFIVPENEFDFYIGRRTHNHCSYYTQDKFEEISGKIHRTCRDCFEYNEFGKCVGYEEIAAEVEHAELKPSEVSNWFKVNMRIIKFLRKLCNEV